MKKALITGGNQGLGLEIAKQLVKKNYRVVLIAREEKKLKQAVKMLGENSSYYVCDIRERKEVNQVVKKIKEDLQSLDVLVNNAGVWTDDILQQDKPELMEQTIKTNLLGQIYINEAFLPLLRSEKVSRIFNVLSSAAVRDKNTLWKTYGASKWGFRGYCHALRKELRDSNIQVMQFFPGGFESNLYEKAGRDNPHNQVWMMKTKDVAEVAVFAITRPNDVYMEEVVVTKHIKN